MFLTVTVCNVTDWDKTSLTH